MGDRVSIQFAHNGEHSIVLFNHWGGMEFVHEAQEYYDDLPRGGSQFSPLDRLEPNTVMVDFTRHFTKDFDRVAGSLYFGATPEDGDNSDNGHHVIQ